MGTEVGQQSPQGSGAGPQDGAKHRLLRDIGRRIAYTFARLSRADDPQRDESRPAAAQPIVPVADSDRISLRRTEAQLRASEKRFRIFSDHATDAFFLHDCTGRILDANQQACVALGYSRDELLGQHPALFDAESSSEHMEALRLRLDAGEIITFDTRHRRKDGTQFAVEIRIRPFESEGKWFRVSLARDITGRKRAEDALLESNILLRAVIEGTSDAVFVKDLDSRYLLINTAGAAILGRPVSDIIGRTDAELFPAETAGVILEHDRVVLHGSGRWAAEEVIPTATGPRTFLTTKDVHRDLDGRAIGTVGISRDVTQMKLLEDALQQAQKMEAVGRLAGGIAHDFNNLLTVINGYSSMLLERMPEGHPDRDLLLNIMTGGERAARLTRQLLAFGRKQVLQPRIIDVHLHVAELQDMLRRLIGEHIALELLPSTSVRQARVDPGQLEQAVVNLAINARDAMPDGGRLSIGTDLVELTPADRLRLPEAQPGRYVCVSVSDSGCGMDEAALARIFEPFYTTKAPGAGTGLGLAMVYGFVHQSGGQIEVHSTPGHGSTFRIYLPAAESAPDAIPRSAHPVATRRGHETVLLVEDEAAVRALFRLALTSAGYRVLEARDGQDALDVAARHDRDIDLLVTDLVMPRMNGRMLIERLKRLRPQLRVIAISGYPGDAGPRESAFEDGVEFLHKPVATSTLVNLVRELLDRIRTNHAAPCADGARHES